MEEVLNIAYKENLPVITYLVNWLKGAYSVDLRNGDIISFDRKDRNKFIKFCKENLNNMKVNYIIAGNKITLQERIINI